MTIRVGRVLYLHAEPFYFDMARRGIELYEMVPSVLIARAEQGEIDAGPIPLVASFRLDDRFQPVAGFASPVSSELEACSFIPPGRFQSSRGLTSASPTRPRTRHGSCMSCCA